MIDTSEFRKGLKVLIEGQPYNIVDFQFVKPGKGSAFTRTTFKNLLNGRVIEMSPRSGEKFAPANVEQVQMQYLYYDGEFYTFMNTETFDQLQMTEDQVGDAKDFLMENLVADVMLFNDRPIAVELPNFVELVITYCEPGVKGDTATGAQKQATLSTGATINVPLFIEQGEKIRIDTRTRSYLERVKK